MYLISSELAALLSQILPVFIVLLILEQSRINAAHRLDHVAVREKPVVQGKISGRRLALLSASVASVIMCLFVVQLGDQGFRDLNQAASPYNQAFMSAVTFSTLIYASTLSVFVYFTILAWRISFTNIVTGPEFKEAVKPSSPIDG